MRAYVYLLIEYFFYVFETGGGGGREEGDLFNTQPIYFNKEFFSEFFEDRYLLFHAIDFFWVVSVPSHVRCGIAYLQG